MTWKDQTSDLIYFKMVAEYGESERDGCDSSVNCGIRGVRR